MKVLIVEDNPEKLASVQQEVSSRFSDFATTIDAADCLSEASKLIYERTYDLIILDLMLPFRHGDTPTDVSEEVLDLVKGSSNNQSTNAIALTGFDDLVDTRIRSFAEAGIGLVLFDEERQQWKQTLALELEKVKAVPAIDFLFVCALEKERQALKHSGATLGAPINYRGLDCISVEIGKLRGVCVRTARMGLVEAAICTAKSIDYFNPSVVAMPGICAGFDDETKLGALIASDICWEYQTGKWTDEGFKMEAYGVNMSPEARSEIATILAEDPTGSRYKDGLFNDEVSSSTIQLAPSTSGSAVVSSAEAMERIGTQHRKVAGLDMEMFSVYQAASSSQRKPVFFGAKTVVDLGDAQKNNHLQTPGSVLSARFVVDVTKRLAKKNFKS
ncbi:phosphorylase family protein [Ruegeria atlantica]|uniref:phosphorylase family protein n=1 Tax=Ruegeria atlantica TaxID=81569 RepID=UPI00147CF676|nr:hypothetical protein [Ruegeria atlantica]